MRRLLSLALGLLIASGMVAFAVFLSGQGLGRADQWVTVVGFFVSAALGMAGLMLAYLTWSRKRKSVGRGAVHQSNSGGRNLANTGVVGAKGRALGGAVGQTGDIEQNNTGGINVANTGSLDEQKNVSG